MSEPNVETLLAVLRTSTTGVDMVQLVHDDTAWAASLAAVGPFFAPDFVFEADEQNTTPDMASQTYRGSEGFRRSIETLTEPYEAMFFDFERIVGSGDRFVSIYRVRARARHTGISFESPLAYIWSFRDGRIVRIQGGFSDPADALKAAGLEE